jgi:hypothetical protein
MRAATSRASTSRSPQADGSSVHRGTYSYTDAHLTEDADKVVVSRASPTRPSPATACPVRPGTRARWGRPTPIRWPMATTSRRAGRRPLPATSTRAWACAAMARSCPPTTPAARRSPTMATFAWERLCRQHLRQVCGHGRRERQVLVQPGPHRCRRALLCLWRVDAAPGRHRPAFHYKCNRVYWPVASCRSRFCPGRGRPGVTGLSCARDGRAFDNQPAFRSPLSGAPIRREHATGADNENEVSVKQRLIGLIRPPPCWPSSCSGLYPGRWSTTRGRSRSFRPWSRPSSWASNGCSSATRTGA